MWQVHFELEDGSVQSAEHNTWESALKEACEKLQTLHYILDPRGQRIGREEIVELCRDGSAPEQDRAGDRRREGSRFRRAWRWLWGWGG
jgi:hypothetical protein